MEFHPRVRRAANLACAAAVAVGLAACSARDGAGPSLFGGGGTAPAKKAYQPSDFLKTTATYCPPVNIRGSTESLTLYERGHENEQEYVRFLASIGTTARECSQSGTTLTVKLGVGGRVVAGPKGGATTLKLPIRVVVLRQMGGDKPLYSQLFQVPVTVAAPDFAANFRQVFDQVSVQVTPEDRDLVVYVGFDEGPARR